MLLIVHITPSGFFTYQMLFSAGNNFTIWHSKLKINFHIQSHVEILLRHNFKPIKTLIRIYMKNLDHRIIPKKPWQIFTSPRISSLCQHAPAFLGYLWWSHYLDRHSVLYNSWDVPREATKCQALRQGEAIKSAWMLFALPSRQQVS